MALVIYSYFRIFQGMFDGFYSLLGWEGGSGKEISERILLLEESVNHASTYKNQLSRVSWSTEKNDLKTQWTKLCGAFYFSKDDMERLELIRSGLIEIGVTPLKGTPKAAGFLRRITGSYRR